MRIRLMTNDDGPRVVAAWNQTLLHDPMTVRHFAHTFRGDPNYEPEGTLVAESEEGRVVGFLSAVVRHTVAGKDGGGREHEFHRGFLKAFFVSEGEEGEAAAAALLAAAESFCRAAGKREAAMTEYAGPYLTPGLDVRYQRLRDLLLPRGYRDLYTIEDVAADLADPLLPARLARAHAQLPPDISISAWDPASLPQMRAFVAEGDSPHWFPVDWESGYSKPHDHVLLLRRRDEILGWAQYSPSAPSAGFGPILVLPRARGNGYGAVLLLECMARARDAGATRMEAGWANTEFYTHHGWSVVRRYAMLVKELV